jgi:hypothetical protein
VQSDSRELTIAAIKQLQGALDQLQQAQRLADELERRDIAALIDGQWERIYQSCDQLIDHVWEPQDPTMRAIHRQMMQQAVEDMR